MIKSISIIVPVFNESNTIADVLQKVSDAKLIEDIKKDIVDKTFLEGEARIVYRGKGLV